MTLYIGLDVGGTNTVCGVVSEEGKVLHKRKQPTEAQLGSGGVIRRIGALVEETVAEAGFALSGVAAVGVGTPGLVNPELGVTVLSSNLGWRNVPLARELAGMTGLPVYIDNDVRMYVLGEALCGAARNRRHVLGVTVGTGLAAAVVHDGKLYYGHGFMAGELGHIQYDALPYACPCGLTGCLETIASATGLVRHAKALMDKGRPSSLASISGSMTASDISRAYDAGDELAVEVMRFAGTMLGQGLAGAVSLLSPEIIVVGGGVAQAGERLLAPVKEQLQKSLLPNYWEQLEVAVARHLDDAGVIGSAMHARQQAEVRQV